MVVQMDLLKVNFLSCLLLIKKKITSPWWWYWHASSGHKHVKHYAFMLRHYQSASEIRFIPYQLQTCLRLALGSSLIPFLTSLSILLDWEDARCYCRVATYDITPPNNCPMESHIKMTFEKRLFLLTGATQFLATAMVVEIIHWPVVLMVRKGMFRIGDWRICTHELHACGWFPAVLPIVTNHNTGLYARPIFVLII